MKKTILAATAAASLLVPAAAGAHATVNAVQPQGKTLTSARQAYVVRVPNERTDADTYQVTMFVPKPLQDSIRVMKKPGWRITLSVGEPVQGGEGDPVPSVLKVTWRTASRGAAIEPLHYDEFPVRWRNPATAQRTCFWIYQTYGTFRRSRWDRVETVKWSGPSTSETPASCLAFTES